MATYVTRNREITKLNRSKDIYVLTDIQVR